MDDPLHAFSERLKARILTAYGLPDEVADLFGLVEAEIRREFPPIKTDREKRAESITKEYLANVELKAIQERHGVSRATVYRSLKDYLRRA
jgi:hypothetical protein